VFSKSLGAIIILTTIIGGCGTTGSVKSCVQGDQDRVSAKLILFREHALFSIVTSPSFWIGECNMGDLANNSYISASLPPGKYYLNGGGASVAVVLEEGKKYYYRYSMSAEDIKIIPAVGAIIKGSSHLSLVNEDYAYKVMPGIRAE